MANWLVGNGYNKFRVTIPRYLSNNYFTEYELIIQFPNNINWKVYKRYSEFLKLYEKLEKLDSKFKLYFPPKRLFKNTSEHFLNQRKKSLEMYINETILLINNYVPRPLARFLEMEKYEIHGITTNLAKLLFKHGQTLLMSNKTFEISVLSVYAINQRLLSPAPTNIYNKPKEDFGNVLEVIESTKSIKIIPQSVFINGPDAPLGTSNIKFESLSFDISIFSSAVTLELNSVEIANLKGLYKINPVVENLKVHHCLKSLEDILFGDLVCRGSSFEDLLNFDGPWRCATNVNFSKNSITSIDKSIVTLKQVSVLDLSSNQISSIENLHYLTFLTVLDLSYNNLVMCQDSSFSYKLGSIRQLFLKGNKLTKLTMIDRMFSLEYLDISDNNISEFGALLPLCRLTCLEFLILKKNPICYHQEFEVVLFDLFLDRMECLRINDLNFSELALNIQNEIRNRRNLKESLLLDSFLMNNHFENSSESNLSRNEQNMLMSFHLDLEIFSRMNSVLNFPDFFNRIVYWFYSAIKKSVIPSKLLWCTEIFSPNRCTKPAGVLLISSSSLNACVIKCSVKTSVIDNVKIITIHARHFINLNETLRNLVVGADKLFIRFDMSNDNRSLYLVNNASSVESFVSHMYHIDDEIVGFGDSRLVFLNEEDRMESLRRFIDVWRLDMITSLRRGGDNSLIKTDSESEILFNSRVMLQMQNGFQLLLTIVVTRQMLCLVDERIYDWPDIRKPSVSDSFSCNFSPLSSSSSQFQFLRTNAYFFHQIKSCMKPPVSGVSNILADWCPVFGHCLQILFYSNPINNKEPINLYFESVKKADKVCSIINQLCENQECKLSTSISFTEAIHPKQHIPTEIPAHLKYLNPSYHEIRLSLSLQCPKLSIIAQSPLNEIESFCYSKSEISKTSKINGIIWSKFFFRQFESNDNSNQLQQENPGLVCLSSNKIDVIYETEDLVISESDCWSDPESDQPDNTSPQTKLNIITINLDCIFKIYTGLFNQWVTLCCRIDENGSEHNRFVLIVRNNDLTKQFLNWLKLSFKDKSIDEVFTDKLENRHDESNIEELLYQIRNTSKCSDVDLIHYTSVEDVRFDYQLVNLDDCSCKDIFTYAVVISNAHISIIRHNIVEYPVRHFGSGAVRQSPKNLQYQILTVIPLYECLQLQLPGHDKNLLVMIIQSNKHTSMSATFKIQLSINCQKEQKHLIDKLRQQWMKCLQVDTPLRVIVC